MKNKEFPGLYKVWERANRKAAWIDTIKFIVIYLVAVGVCGLMLTLFVH